MASTTVKEILQRTYYEDTLPKSKHLSKNEQYVIHDLAYREAPCPGMGGAKKLKDQKPKTQYKAHWKNFVQDTHQASQLTNAMDMLKTMYPFLLKSESRVIDLNDLKDDKYYQKYFLLENGTSPRKKITGQLSVTKLDPVRKLSKESIINETEMITIKKPKMPGRKIRQKCVFVKEHRKSLGNASTSHGITLKKLFDAGDYAKELLKIVSPKKLGNSTSGQFYRKPSLGETTVNSAINATTATDHKMQIADKRWKKQLLTLYSNKRLSDFISKDKIKHPYDVAVAFEHAMNWNLATLYKQMSINRKFSMRSTEVPVDVDFMDLNQGVVNNMLKENEIKVKDTKKVRQCKSLNVSIVDSSAETTPRTPAYSITTKKDDSSKLLYQNIDTPPISTITRINTPERNPIIIAKPQQIRLDTLYAIKKRVEETRKNHAKLAILAEKCKKDLERKMLKSFSGKSLAELTNSLNKPNSLIKANTRKTLERVKSLILQGDYKKVQKVIKAQAMDKRKEKVKPKLDTKQPSGEGNPFVNRERLDALLSRQFYLNSKKKIKYQISHFQYYHRYWFILLTRLSIISLHCVQSQSAATFLRNSLNSSLFPSDNSPLQFAHSQVSSGSSTKYLYSGFTVISSPTSCQVPTKLSCICLSLSFHLILAFLLFSTLIPYSANLSSSFALAALCSIILSLFLTRSPTFSTFSMLISGVSVKQFRSSPCIKVTANPSAPNLPVLPILWKYVKSFDGTSKFTTKLTPGISIPLDNYVCVSITNQLKKYQISGQDDIDSKFAHFGNCLHPLIHALVAVYDYRLYPVRFQVVGNFHTPELLVKEDHALLVLYLGQYVYQKLQLSFKEWRLIDHHIVLMNAFYLDFFYLFGWF
eukprot:TRINITY_DN1856_c0_g1_i1.p1 TRINITY_DN1856_c0_g1~~TRINITY_DN1856_c0_g1_i1.p1  ORF type:complete len:908 (+),score=37.55 TRINITY_DN1856_c0_g1_i1:113-2725(+)